MTCPRMIKSLFTTVLACLVASVFGQTALIDSLEKEFLTVSTKEEKSEILEALFWGSLI